jgi:Putative DNA-binding domain
VLDDTRATIHNWISGCRSRAGRRNARSSCGLRSRPVLLPSIRRLALADLDEDTLRELVYHGEDLLVERKRALPNPPGFGAAAASFANTLGGWILLGVGDDKTLHGYTKPANLDLQSYLAALLRKECDPLPPFVAEMFELEGKPIAVLRVFESTDPPHIVRGTGAVYVRTSKGKEPVDDHRTLLELARRGADAEAKARDRLVSQTLILQALVPPDVDPGRVARSPDEEHVVVHVRAAPLTVTPQFADWPITKDGGVHACFVAAQELLPTDSNLAEVAAAARGAVAHKTAPSSASRGSWSVLAVADSGGVVAVKLMQPTQEGDWVYLDDLRRTLIRPVLDAIVEMLSTAEAYGRAAFDTWICVPGDVSVDGSQLRHGPGTQAREIHISGELTIPADDDEVGALGTQWEREFARHFGIKRWED